MIKLNFLSFGKKEPDPRIRSVYDQLVVQARKPTFYTALHVDDTLNGRFDMIVLHIFLFFHRMKEEDETMRAFGQEVFDHFVDDMDGSLREMGVGYQAIPKRIRKMGEAFYGRVAAYDAALDDDDPETLKDVIARNIFAEKDVDEETLERFAGYVRATAAAFAANDAFRIINEPLHFPEI